MDPELGRQREKRTAHLALYDGLAEMEVGHLLAELHTGRITGTNFNLVTVADSPEPVISMGGIRMVPDALLADLEHADSDLLILPGAEMWDAGGGESFAAAAGRFLDAGVPVAATSGATAGLARAGLLDTRNHTSVSAEYLAMTGYAGGERYLDERVVVDGDLITTGAQSPVQFARAVLERLGLADERTLDTYEALDTREQLAASRARIVEAGYEERRRLGRDLHDGAQQELVAAILSLKLAQRSWHEAPAKARGLVETALEQMQAGLRDLRDLAAGLHPSVLIDRGLGAALEALASRAPMPVEVGQLPPQRLSAPVETSAYFVVAEALTNAAKHARASHVQVDVRVADAAATVEVRDNGVGGADTSAGTGLRGLADRVSALGGRLEIESPPGTGTTVRAQIPVARGGTLHPP